MIRWARKRLAQPESFCVLDVESTGLEYDDETCSIAVLGGDASPLLDTLVRPDKPIPDTVVAIHGITDEKVRNAPRFVDIYEQLLEVIGDKSVLIYNSNIAIMNRSLTACGSSLQVERYEWVPFENGSLQQAHLAFPSGVTCVMEKYARFVGEWSQYWGNYRYQPLWGGDHTALGDCKAVLELLRHMAGATLTYPTEEEQHPVTPAVD
jgi:DNA polymerase III subunit epsilon